MSLAGVIIPLAGANFTYFQAKVNWSRFLFPIKKLPPDGGNFEKETIQGIS